MENAIASYIQKSTEVNNLRAKIEELKAKMNSLFEEMDELEKLHPEINFQVIEENINKQRS